MNRSRPSSDAAGPHDAIVDVAGVSVGHVDIRTPSLHTGLTAIVPYPAEVAERKLFIGRFSVDGGDAMSGLAIAEDFGTFSSPIVFAPAPVVGRVYESLIRYGLGRDTGLSTAAGWPPVVVGIDDTAVNDPVLVRKALTRAHAAEALASAGRAVPTGNAGVGGGLQAFGYKGGIGTASRRAGEYALGVLAAVNGGRELRLAGRELPTGERVGGAADLCRGRGHRRAPDPAPTRAFGWSRRAGAGADGLVEPAYARGPRPRLFHYGPRPRGTPRPSHTCEDGGRRKALPALCGRGRGRRGRGRRGPLGR